MARSGYNYRRADINEKIRLANWAVVNSIRIVDEPKLFGDVCSCGMKREAFDSRRKFKDHKETCVVDATHRPPE